MINEGPNSTDGGTYPNGRLRDSHLPNIDGHLDRQDGVPMPGWDNENHATGEDPDMDLAPNQINVHVDEGGDGQFINSLGLLNHVKIPYDSIHYYLNINKNQMSMYNHMYNH